MDCPTCDYNMEQANSPDERLAVFHCATCGTLAWEDGIGVGSIVPKLVGRCRAFKAELMKEDLDPGEWYRQGIPECLSKEEQP